jgi:hypothetical protein
VGLSPQSSVRFPLLHSDLKPLVWAGCVCVSADGSWREMGDVGVGDLLCLCESVHNNLKINRKRSHTGFLKNT